MISLFAPLFLFFQREKAAKEISFYYFPEMVIPSKAM